MNKAKKLFEKGQKDFKNGLLNEAFVSFLDASKCDSSFAPAYCQMGIILHRKKKFNQAVIYLKKAIELKPENYHFYYNLANCWLSQDRFSRAISNYNKAIQLGCNYAECYWKLGLALEKLDRLKQAETTQQKALEINPNLEQASIALSRVRNQITKNKAQTLANLKAYFENNSKSNDVFDAYISLGDNCEAGLQFLRIGYTESSFFRFTSNNLNAIFNIVQNNFNDIFSREYIIPRPNCKHMVKNIKYNIAFHSELISEIDSSTGKQKFSSNYDFDKVFENEVSKVNYLIKKWQELVNSNKRILFILKHDSENRALKQEDVEKLVNLFSQKYKNHNFKIACLQLAKFQEPKWNSEHLINHYFPYFAPRSSAKEADFESWDNFFQNYPLAIF